VSKAQMIDCPTCHGNIPTCFRCGGLGVIQQERKSPTDDRVAIAVQGPKPTSREILTEVLEQAIAVSNNMTWFNFEDAAANEWSRGIERQLWNLRGTLGDYVHALREEGK